MDFAFITPNVGDLTEVQAGVGISVASGTGPIPIITNSSTDLITTAGDLLYGTAADTVARLGIGTASQVLAVNSGATAPEWVTPAGGGANWSLLNSGGTALTGAATITVTGISNADKIKILIKDASTTSAGEEISFRLNTDSGSNYNFYGGTFEIASTYSAGNFYKQTAENQSSQVLALMSNNAGSAVSANVDISGCNSSGLKMYSSQGFANNATGNGQRQWVGGGYWNNSATVTSVSIVSSGSNFDAGTVFIYTSA
jgi:hypothetical protein